MIYISRVQEPAPADDLEPAAAEADSSNSPWFENKDLFEKWVLRGLRVLERLGIDAQIGDVADD